MQFKAATAVLATIVLAGTPVAATKNTSNNDSIAIGSIPARGAAMSGEPYITLEMSSLAHNNNSDIRQWYERIKALADSGITSNATRFHQPTTYLDAVWQGQQVRVFYVKSEGLEKYSAYEAEWKRLYGELLAELTQRANPER